MPTKAASAKHARQSVKRTVVNRSVKTELRDAIKQARKLITAKKLDEAKVAVSAAVKLLDKAARKKTMPKNTASRKKSRLMQALAKAK
jgi:small subunit ribosomal protein S20